MLLRLIGAVVVVIALYSVITEPRGSAAMVRESMSGAGNAGTSLTQFMSAIVEQNRFADHAGSGSDQSSGPGHRSGSGHATPGGVRPTAETTPHGGVDTGDGSTPIPR